MPVWDLWKELVSLLIFYIFSYLLSKTMGCFSGCLMSSDSIQKLFCGIYSVFKCSFGEFGGESDLPVQFLRHLRTTPDCFILIKSEKKKFHVCFYFPKKLCIKFFLIFIYLAAPGSSCSMWDLVPLPEIEPRHPVLRVQSLSLWTTREVPLHKFLP